MPEQIYIGNFSTGLKTNRLPFNIDNDAFPTMFNFYSWRGRAKRKRGTRYLGQLSIQVKSVLNVTPPKIGQVGQLTLFGGSVNLFATTITNVTQATQAVVTITGSIFFPGQQVIITGVIGMTQLNNNTYTIVSVTPTSLVLNVNSTAFTAYISGGTATITGIFPSIQPGSVSFIVGSNTYTEPSPPNGALIGTPSGSGTINYATGEITILGGGVGPLTGTFNYYPELPVMALADLVTKTVSNMYPLLLAFDTEYSYQISGSQFYNVNYYVTGTPFIWSGADYQQFWTTNYSSALWATNNNPGLHILAGTYVSGSTLTAITFNFILNALNYTQLLVGDVLWFNEWTSGGVTLNNITGVITSAAGAASGNYVVTFTTSQTVSGTGIVQVLTNSIPNANSVAQDGIRYYTGDPTSATGLPAGKNLGWVNFAPPLTSTTVSIDNTTPALYYLVGALAILPFKDRLLFFSPYIQSSTGVPIQLIDTVLWSWNGTPYYQTSDAVFTPTINVVPAGETANVKAYYVDQTGLGGYLPAGISQPIITISNNEDVLLIGFGGNGRKTRFVYTGNDLQPFLFFNINSELPSSATFSAVALDRGVIDIGQYGIAMTDQQSSQRVDLDIPDSVFQIQALNNGVQRVNAVRDFFKEWIYFSYPVENSLWKFPTQTFLFNYRDNTWAILYENFTAHGSYRAKTKKSWKTTGYKSWKVWNEAWNSAAASPQFPNIIAGNPQGYVLIIAQGTGEAVSGTISAISNNGGLTQITSYNHCVTDANQNTGQGDYLLIQGVLGLLTSTITSITNATQAVISTVNTFSVGQLITISGVNGMIELNGNTYEIVFASGTSLIINVDSTTFGLYSSGGSVTSALNGLIGEVDSIIDANNFVLDIPFPSITYVGLGTFTRLSQPLLQTKQFPVYWNEGRQTRLSVQKYLMDYTVNSQITVNINLSQDPDDAWNSPIINVPPNSLVYSQILYTCPESTNIGLTPANNNLQMPTANTQYQIWHRFNTSLIGDSVQIGFTLSPSQMKNITYATSEIGLQGIHLTVDRGPQLA